MANDINSVVLVGRLTRDAELKYTSSGSAVCKFSLALNRRKKTGDTWGEEANFFDIVLWGRQGEAIHQYLGKGKQVAVQGELRQNRWEQDGKPRSKVEIHALNVQLLSGGPSGGSSGGTSGGSGGSGRNSDSQASSPDNSPKGGAYGGGPEDFEDDIPF